jgi:hypothetical protein
MDYGRISTPITFVPDNIQAAVEPPVLQFFLCLHCFDCYAIKANVDYSGCIMELYFAGDYAVIDFEQSNF